MRPSVFASISQHSRNQNAALLASVLLGCCFWGHASLAESSAGQLDFRFYGLLNTNLISHSGRPGSSLEAPVRALPGSLLDPQLPQEGALVFTLRQSRVGFRASYDEATSWWLRAHGEVDFLGLHETQGPGTTTQIPLRLRHAYFEAGTEDWRWTFGQTWSVVARRRPTSYGRTAMALFNTAGALTSRLPQIGVAWRVPLGGSQPPPISAPPTPSDANSTSSGTALRYQIALARPQSGDGEGQFTRFEMPDPGMWSGWPFLQTRVSYESAGIELGLASHLGRERFVVAKGTETEPGYRHGELRYANQDVITWMLGFDGHLDGKSFWVSTHLWVGENVNGLSAHHGVVLERWDLDDTFANGALFGQVRSVQARRALGGFGEIGVRLMDAMAWVFSAGIETGPSNEADYGQLYQNVGLFTGWLWSPLAMVDVSLEYLYLASWYRAHLGHRETPGYRPDQDLLFGAALPTREWQGRNDTLSLNLRLRF